MSSYFINLPNTLFHFLSNYFELLLVVEGAVFIMLLCLMLAIRFTESHVQNDFSTVLQSILYRIVVVGQFFLLIMMCSVYWINYHQWPDSDANFTWAKFQFPDNVLSDTSWVQKPIVIYFIKNNELRSIKTNGDALQTIFTANDLIREYHFSPDGKKISIVTQSQLYLLNRDTLESHLVDAIWKTSQPSADLKGVISGVRWSPDSTRFCYEITRWSVYATQQNMYLYQIASQTRQALKIFGQRRSSPYWDSQGENLYYLHHEVKNTAIFGYPYEVKVFRIGLEEQSKSASTLKIKPELVASIPYDKNTMPIEHLKIRNIKLFLDDSYLSFGRFEQIDDWVSASISQESARIDQSGTLNQLRNKWNNRSQKQRKWKSPARSNVSSWVQKRRPSSHRPKMKDSKIIYRKLVSDQGSYVGIDQEDYLYFVNSKWFRKRLFKIPREIMINEIPKHQYKGGDLTLKEMQWIPGGRYIILQHTYLKTLLLEPSSGKIGMFPGADGDTFGWYVEVKKIVSKDI